MVRSRRANEGIVAENHTVTSVSNYVDLSVGYELKNISM